MSKNRFVAVPSIPWVEVRCTEESTESYKDHSHPELSVGAVTQGTAIMRMQGHEYVVPTGSLVVIDPEIVHSCNPKDGSRSYLMAYFDASWYLSLLNDICPDPNLLQRSQTPLINSPDLYSRFLNLITGLNQPGFALETSERLTVFIADLLQLNSSSPQQKHPVPPRHIVKLKELLRCSLDENMSLQELAAEVGYNPYHLLRSFKKNVGLTPHEYRLNLRIDRAKELLKSGLPPAAVAAETGFVDQSHFHRTFRQFAAATPRQYQSRS